MKRTSKAATAECSEAQVPPEAAGLGPRLKLSDVKAVFRLVGEVRELGADPQQWRPHMVRKLGRLIGATIVVSSEVHFRRNAHTGTMRVIDIGWVCDPEGEVTQVNTEREDERPEAFWLVAGSEKQEANGNSAAGSSDQASSSAAPGSRGRDEDGKEGEELVPVTPTTKIYGGTSFILSQVTLPHVGAVDQLGLHRQWGDAPFTRAQHRLVRIFHLELARLWRRDVLRQAKEPSSDLPPRLSQTLDALLEGDSEKEIAAKLDLSRHTIHNYVKALHQRFQVSSRGELLAKAGQARADAGPRLSLTLPRRTGRKPAGEMRDAT